MVKGHVILMLHRIHHKLAPEKEKIIKPKGFPALPLNNEDAFSEFQKFLIFDDNFYLVVSKVPFFVCNSLLSKIKKKFFRYIIFLH